MTDPFIARGCIQEGLVAGIEKQYLDPVSLFFQELENLRITV
jgi:hypothetical protein